MLKKVYDPRINKYCISNNPALLLADLLQYDLSMLSEDFWRGVICMANYCDEEVISNISENTEKRRS